MTDKWKKISLDDLKNDEQLKEDFTEEFAPHLVSGYSTLRKLEDDKVLFDDEFIISEEDHVYELDIQDDFIRTLLSSESLEKKSSMKVEVDNSTFDVLPKKLYFLVEIKAPDGKWSNVKELIKNVQSWESPHLQ